MTACPTGKQRYRDRIAALLALSKISGETNRVRIERRAYRCEKCRGWHLTSQPYHPRSRTR